jgi:hypothetical protein
MCNRSVEDAYSSIAYDPTFTFVSGACYHTIDFLCALFFMITSENLLTSLFDIRNVYAACENKVSGLFLAGLGDFRVKDSSAKMNKVAQVKNHWEDQISSLGGPDFRVSSVERMCKGI